jgi:hypothetical protein
MGMKLDANDKSPISEIATQHIALFRISTSNMLWSNFANRTFVGRIKLVTSNVRGSATEVVEADVLGLNAQLFQHLENS